MIILHGYMAICFLLWRLSLNGAGACCVTASYNRPTLRTSPGGCWSGTARASRSWAIQVAAAWAGASGCDQVDEGDMELACGLACIQCTLNGETKAKGTGKEKEEEKEEEKETRGPTPGNQPQSYIGYSFGAFTSKAAFFVETRLRPLRPQWVGGSDVDEFHAFGLS